MPWNSFNTIRNRGKKDLPYILFNRVVNTSTVTVNGTDYRVYDISGSTANNTWNTSNTPITCSIYSRSPITIYYLVVGSGGSGTNAPSSSFSGGGGAGGGGFLEGSFTLNASSVVKNIGIKVGAPTAIGVGGQSSMIDCSFQNTTIVAGGGGPGGQANTPSAAETVTGTISIRGGGGGGGSASYSLGNGGAGSYQGGYAAGTIGTVSNGGGGGGANSRSSGGGANQYSGPGSGAPAISINPGIVGIYQKFLGTTFCGGGSGAYRNNGGSFGASGNGTYGSGGGGGADTTTVTDYRPGKTGLVAIAIRVSDIS